MGGQWEDKALITLPLSLVSAQLLYEIVNDMAVIIVRIFMHPT